MELSDARYRVSSVPPENDRLWLCVTAVRVTSRSQFVFAAPRAYGLIPPKPPDESAKPVEHAGRARQAVESDRHVTNWGFTYARYSAPSSTSRRRAGEAAAT